nr:MBL fold metallo-hydrolase [Lachnospiraceae bacterium]
MEKQLYIKEMRPGIFLLDEAHEATGYLVVGNEKACVIDTMNGYVDLYQAVRNITDLPLIVVNTHGHPDHIYGNIYFEEAYIHPADLELARMFEKEPDFIKECEAYHLCMPPFKTIKEGDVIDLGGRHLEVFELPGHTQGSILLLLAEERILFTGDAVNHHLWMQLEGCASIEEMMGNLDRVMFLETRADKILHGHARDFDDISLMRCLREGARTLVEGKTEKDMPYHYFGGEVKQHPFDCLPDRYYQQADHVICYDPENVRK